ncbi:catechol 2,3-dioxygenase-like lactoylglutathione lyase family enzyme [Nocardia sp. GAS34]|uniref:VOC family protein n=1 Tax=unclassified Nocardia TaxID=2637762 RepID=UPI003D1A1EB5
MTIELNHIIIPVHDKHASARFVAEILGVPVAAEVGPFVQIRTGNGVTLDFMTAGRFEPHHCAFLVSEKDFDAVFARLAATGRAYWADPMHRRAGEIDHQDGGRAVYFEDPSGHNLEILTTP